MAKEDKYLQKKDFLKKTISKLKKIKRKGSNNIEDQFLIVFFDPSIGRMMVANDEEKIEVINSNVPYFKLELFCLNLIIKLTNAEKRMVNPQNRIFLKLLESMNERGLIENLTDETCGPMVIYGI